MIHSKLLMSTMNRDLIFHLLDLQARDVRIESEHEDVREITYESNSDSDDDEDFKKQSKKKKLNNTYGDKREFVIHLFGAMETGQTIRCDITGFRPTFYIRLPEEKTSQAAELIKHYIISQGIPIGHLNFSRVMKRIFYGFTAKTEYPFLQVDMPSLAMFRNVRNLFLDESLNFVTKRPLDGILRGKQIEVFEANIDPMLRFLHSQNIQPCGWVRILDGIGSITEDSPNGLVVECEFDQVHPTRGPRVSAPFLTASWDIECFSMTGDFPLAKRTWKKPANEIVELTGDSEVAAELIVNSLSVDQTPCNTLPKGMTPIYCKLKKGMPYVSAKLNEPKIQKELDSILQHHSYDNNERIEEVMKFLEKTLKTMVKLVGDPVIQIGTTLTRGTADTVERHLFVFPDSAPIPGIDVHAYPTEKEMILGWFEWMIQRNPDILIGYNVFGFDEAYLWHRAEELDMITPNSPIHEFTRLFALSSEMKLEEKFLSSSAMGDNRMHIWTTHGRLQIDMFHYIKRGYTLPSYKLDEVTKYFMSGKLKEYTYEDSTCTLTLTVAGAVKDVKIGRSITLLDETGETISPKLTVLDIIDGKLIFDCSGIQEDILETMVAEMDDAVKWVIVKDDVSPQDIFRLHRESAEGRAIVGKYCLQDCDLVIDLYKKLETFNNSMSMANVCTVPVGYIFTRGQGIKIESLIFKFCRDLGILIPVLPVPKQGGGEDSYEGAIVLDPQPGFYSTSPIGVCDFASLYPSTIVSENISHDSLVWVKDFKDDGSLISHQWGSEQFDNCDGYAYTDIEFDIIRSDPEDKRKMPRKMKCGRRICRFAQPLDGTKLTLPQITTWLLNARSSKKKEMKAEKDPERYALLDSEQLAYKLTGNSLYGQLGSGTFKIRLQALAASVTAYGRKQILFAKAAIEKFYGPESNDPRCSARCMAKVVYGDSVTGDTPVLIRYRGKEHRIQIEQLHELENNSKWISDGEKEFYELYECESWTDDGWTPIHRIIRHRLPEHKKILRVWLKEGFIDVTDDHSLLSPDRTMIKPTQLGKGSRLLSTRFVDEGGDCVTSIESISFKKDIIVFDLTTDNHHFQAGPEGLIVHNTDSLFVEFNIKNPETGELLQGREARQATIDMTGEAGHFISKTLAAPHDFEFDKAFDPLLMFSKKRYAGNMYEENADDYVHKYMGIALKRRDNAPIVKTIFGGAMKMLLDKRDVEGAFKFVKDKCLELVDGKVSLSQLTVTKSLRADYADPSRIAHKALADRITDRDPGNAPAAGDRIGYVYISPKAGQLAAKLQGDRIETPLFIKENKLIPDYRHYIEHQLQNPISQAFGLLLERIPGFSKEMIRGCPTMSENLDKYLAFRESKAAELLFSECLKRYEKMSQRSAMMGMFGSKSVITSSIRSALPSSSSEEKKKDVIRIVSSSSSSTTTIQRTMSNYMLDSFLVDNIKKKDRAKKKESQPKMEANK